MNTLRRTLLATLTAALLAPLTALAGGTADEAKAMVERSLEHIKKVGTEKAFKDFSDPANKDWHDRDLYLYAYNFNHINVAHGANAKLIGKDLSELKTPDGKILIREMVQMAKTKGEGWIDYEWTNPETKKIDQKSGYLKRIPGFDGFVGSGIYK